jgi:hypothetical protein
MGHRLCVCVYVSILCVCVQAHCETSVLLKGLSELMGHRLYVCVCINMVCVCAIALRDECADEGTV